MLPGLLPAAAVPGPGSQASARPALAALPPCFEANQGQADARFAFIARGQRHVVQLAADAAVVSLAAHPASSARQLILNLVGARPEARPVGLDPLAGAVNYFLGNDPQQWRHRIPLFGRVRFDAVLPGIDVVYYANGRQLEYDFLVAAGADPGRIRLRVEGADAIRIGAQGELEMDIAGHRLTQPRPVAYQTVNGGRRDVAVRYEVDGTDVTFALGRWDAGLPLVIDPVISYSTYLGAMGQQNGWAMAVDNAGAVYVAGETLAALNGLPVSGFQTNFGGGTSTSGDAFVAKLNPAGTAYEYLTYLGHGSLDGAVAVAVDGTGHAFVTGYTTSRKFPVTPGALQTNIAGQNVYRTETPPSDAFVTKLSPDGATLVYSTFLGGTNFDSATAIAVDALGQACVVGYTESAAVYRRTNIVCTTRCTNDLCGPTSCKTEVSRGPDFAIYSRVTNIVRVTASTNAMGSNVVYQVVETTLAGLRVLEPGFPVTNAAQPFLAGQQDVFVARLKADGSGLVHSTLLGGSDEDIGNGVALDPAGNAYVVGYTESPDFPVTSNAFQIVIGERRDAFVASIGPAGVLRYATYLGGGKDDVAFRVAADGAGHAVLTGGKASEDFPTTPGAWNRGGVMRTTDGAALWVPSGAGLTHTVVEALVRTPGGVLLAGTPRGVFRSHDAGLTWTPSFTSLDVGGVLSLASDLTGNRLYAGTGEGLLLSTNAGADWFSESGGLGSRMISAIAHTAPSGTLLAGTAGAGVFRSTNAAASWKTANGGLGNLVINAFAVHPLNDAILYVATDGGVFRSTNNGTSWRGANAGLTTKKTQALALDPTAPGTLYAGTTRGVFKSVNDGANWTVSNTGLGNSNVMALAVDPLAPGTVYAGTTNGLFKSINGGANWSASSTGLMPRVVRALVADPVASGHLHAGLRSSNSFGGSNDVFVTKMLPDGSGLAWSLVLGGRKNDQGYGIALDSGGRVFIGGSTDSTNFPSANAGSFQRSTNAGKSDAFLAWLSADGSELLFSMFLGGKAPDYGYDVAVDGSDSAYLTGRTQSSNFPTNSALQPGFGGKSDAFVVKVVPMVTVAVARDADTVTVRWPGPMPGYQLEGAQGPDGPWTPVSAVPQFKDGWSYVAQPCATACGFYRLRRVE